MTDRPGLDMSFSGLKTRPPTPSAANGDDEIPDPRRYRLAFEDAVVDTLAIKVPRVP